MKRVRIQMLYPWSYEGTATKVSNPGGSPGPGNLAYPIVPQGTVTSYLPVPPATGAAPLVTRVTFELSIGRRSDSNFTTFGRKLGLRPR
ncbi:MAG: hypothetical protein IH609_06190 [Dehalococcoidia bacterium]|nr:hypothetical protein [Dehalococcoidia bacterium]